MRGGVLDRCLTTSADAARAYRAGDFARSLALDPTFALAHAALALMGHHQGAAVDVPNRIRCAQLHARRSSDAERSHVCAVAGLLRGDADAIARHLRQHPEDDVLRVFTDVS